MKSVQPSKFYRRVFSTDEKKKAPRGRGRGRGRAKRKPKAKADVQTQTLHGLLCRIGHYLHVLEMKRDFSVFEITELIEDEEIDLVVSGTHGGHGLKGWLLGSTTEQLVRKSSCSVFVVKPQGYPYLRD